jgi:hypothetical protein
LLARPVQSNPTSISELEAIHYRVIHISINRCPIIGWQYLSHTRKWLHWPISTCVHASRQITLHCMYTWLSFQFRQTWPYSKMRIIHCIWIMERLHIPIFSFLLTSHIPTMLLRY